MRRFLGIALVVLVAVPLGVAAPAAAAPGAGRPCAREGATATVGGRTLVCQRKADGRLAWTVRRSASSAIPSIIENWGFRLGPYDNATQTAGAMALRPLPFPADSVIQTPITYYGGGPARPQDPPGFVDPQMTFILPIGTEVTAIATGRVCSVTRLQTGYSNDYSIGIAPTCTKPDPSGRSQGTVATWEHEHVMEPRVRVGDRVVAGQPIAVVSHYTTDNWLYSAGLGLVEIGILTGGPGGQPMHVCPAQYLKASARATLLAALAAAARAYETNAGRTFYAPATLATGCITTSPALG
jgi:hypothetical protein